jgi:hypothetical protein
VSDITAERLRALLDYDPETGVFTWKVNRGGTAKVGEVAGGVDAYGYICIRVNQRAYKAHRLAWLYTHGGLPIDQIDHINGVRADNRLSNLREVNNQRNAENRRSARNVFGFLGVTRHRNRWKAQITVGGRAKYIGLFISPTEAHAAYLEAKRAMHEGCTI